MCCIGLYFISHYFFPKRTSNTFRFKSIDEIEEVEKQFNNIIEDDEDDTNGFTDSADADDIFG